MKLDKTIRVFSGGTAIITGGASGIGRALAEELAKRGCEVVLADRQIELAEEAASGIQALGGKATAVELDVTDFPALQRLVQNTVAHTNRLDYMFNNAGIAMGGRAQDYGIEEWNQIIDVNLRGVVNGVQAAYGVMMKQGFGHIINTASITGLMPTPGQAPYSMTKHAVVGLSLSLRAEAALLGIRVSVLCPGAIRTPILYGGGKYGKMLRDVPQEKIHQMWERLKPMAPGDFAKKVIDSVAKNKPIVVEPPWYRRLWWINRISPRLALALAQRSFEKRIKELGPAWET